MGRILVGERLSHFELEEFVGGGGMGAVFRATDTMLNRTVAVKVLSRDQTDEETLKRFKNEAQNAARLDHERIARVYYVGEDKGWHYIVFEYIDGVNVRACRDQQLRHFEIAFEGCGMQRSALRPDTRARIRISAAIDQPPHQLVMVEIHGCQDDFVILDGGADLRRAASRSRSCRQCAHELPAGP